MRFLALSLTWDQTIPLRRDLRWPRGNLRAMSSAIGRASCTGRGQRLTRGIDRAGMEGFVITVLRAAVIELEAYVHSVGSADDIDELLSWVRQRKTTFVEAFGEPAVIGARR